MQSYISSKYPALASHDFRIFWIAQLISNIGSQMQFVALNWQVYVLTHSAFALGFIGFLRFVPILIFSLLGGSYADAHNRKKALYITQVISIILSIILAITTFTHTITIYIMYIVTVLFAVTLSFDLPSRQAIVPNLVDKKDIQSAMSLNSIMFQVALVLGPTLSGFLIAKAGLEIIYVLNALSFIAIIWSLFNMHNSGEIEGEAVSISLKTIKEGLAFVKSKTMIWSTMLLDFFSTFFSSAMALLPIFAKDILAVGPIGLGLLYAAPSIGAVLAGLFVAHKERINHQGKILLISVAMYALGTIVFGFSHIFILSFIALIIIGAGDSISTIIRNIIRQVETPDYIRGRMTSIMMIFFLGGPQLGDFEAGVLAGYLGAPLSVVTGGIGTLIVVGIMSISIPALRAYNHHE